MTDHLWKYFDLTCKDYQQVRYAGAAILFRLAPDEQVDHGAGEAISQVPPCQPDHLPMTRVAAHIPGYPP